MLTCPKCRNSNFAAGSQYCPMCGSPAQAAQGPIPFRAGNAAVAEVGQMLVNYLIGAAERKLQNHVQQGVSPLTQIVEQFTGPAGPPVPSNPPPAWYEEAFREGQPKMDPNEVARRQAAAHARGRQATQLVQMAINSMRPH